MESSSTARAIGDRRRPSSARFRIGFDDALDGLVVELVAGNARLVTVRGPAGSGKTRLAREAARCVGHKRPIVVDVEHASTRDVFVATVLLAFAPANAECDDSIEAVSQVGRLLRDSGVILVLAGLERAVAAVGDVIRQWLAMAPSARIVVTSRHVLGLEGEQVFEVPLVAPANEEHGPAPNRMVIAADGSWFRGRGGERVDLSRRGPLRRLLAALAHEHRTVDPRALSTLELFTAGWPNDVASIASCKNRVWVAVSDLRRLGLGDAIVSRRPGYRLDPALDIEIARAP